MTDGKNNACGQVVVVGVYRARNESVWKVVIIGGQQSSRETSPNK